MHKRNEMLDDNGKVPVVMNQFKKLKIRMDLEKDMEFKQKKVINEITEEGKIKAKREMER